MKKPIRGNEGAVRNGRASFTALIVEDDDIYRSLYKKRLRTIVPRARVVEAGDGYAALLKVAEGTPDIVLLDLHTPSFSGFEFLEILKKHDEYAALPVVVITSSPSESVTRFLSLPNVHVFHKPIRIALLDRILSLIVKKSGLQITVITVRFLFVWHGTVLVHTELQMEEEEQDRVHKDLHH